MLLMFYSITIILFGLVILFHISGLGRYEFLAACSAMIANLLALSIIFYQTGHFPVYNTFESFLFASFIMGGMESSCQGSKDIYLLSDYIYGARY
jgi:hypothetical protein